MKRRIGLISVLAVLAAVLFLPVLISCNDRGTQLRQALAAADSLMMTDPQAALDTLLTIDSADAARLPRADRALYTLLRTEAGYKCWLPVAENTAISEAVDYYRRKGPEDRLARALTMQGAVLTECGDPDGAMLAYKEAEPLIERSGDLEQLGLLHTHIASLYQDNILDNRTSVERYGKALECFYRAELTERIMYTHLSIARVLMYDSTEKATEHLQKGLSMALEYKDTTCILSAYELLTHLYYDKGDYRSVVRLANRAFRQFGRAQLNGTKEGIYTSILYNCAESYAESGNTDSAKIIVSGIPVRDKYDSLYVYSLYADIAEADKDYEKALDYQKEINSISADILQESHDSYLADIEKKYEDSILREEIYRRGRNNFFMAFILSLTVILAMILYLVMNKLLRKQKAETARQTDIAHTLSQTASRLTQELRTKNGEIGFLHTELALRENSLAFAEEEADRMRQEKRQEEKDRADLERMLVQQASANARLMQYYGSAYRAMQDIVTIYDTRSSNPRHFMDDALDVAREFISDMNSLSNAKTVIDTAYPGFTDSLLAEFSWLQSEDMHLIVLTCFGYPNGTVSSLLHISEANLAVRRTRLARKMGLDESLTKYLKKRLYTYRESTQ